MEILAAVAGKLAEYTVEPIGRQVDYLAHYKTNYHNLQTKLEDLGAARDEVQHKADQVKRRGKRIETTVLNWKRRVDAIITETEEFLKDSRHAQAKCLHGFCPHPGLRYQLSKKAIKLGEEIDQLYGQREFSNFEYEVTLQDPCLISTGDYCKIDSRDSTVRRVMNALGNPETEMVLVWGIGGVGKTTLVEEVLRQAMHENLFDDVVMVKDVKENSDLVKIQKEIVKKLGLSIEENDTLAERAPKLCDRIKDKRILVALDDVWEEIDLVAIGLPRLVNCKVLLTSRSRKKLSLDTRSQEDIPLDVLNEDEAWSLFEKMAGDVVVKDSRIRSVAIEVAKKCGRLPILIVTVARAMKDRNGLSEWRDTRRRLGAFDKKGFGEKAYLALEWSYNQLEEEELKPLFLLCGILVVQNHVYLPDLLKYGFGLGLIKNVNKIEEARDALDALVGKLKDSCLLLESDKNRHVRMHDLVCEVAVLIARKEQDVLSVEFGGELKEWPNKDFFERCSKMSLKSSNIPMLSQLPEGEYHKLEMLMFSEGAGSMEIPADFFSEMEKLRVLGFIGGCMLSLPSSLEFLKNLKTLSLEACVLEDVTLVGCLSNLEILSFAQSNIKLLPKEIGQLIQLRWLDLSDCASLKVISPDVISRLKRLEELTMRNVTRVKWEAERGGSNASLLELKDLSQLTALDIHIPNANVLPPNLFSGDKLVRYQISIGDVWNYKYRFEKTMAETNLNTLKLQLTTSNELDQGIITLLKRCEDLSLNGTESVNGILRQLHVEDFQQLINLHLHFQQLHVEDFTNIINRKVVFPHLTTLNVDRCNHLQFLFSFSMAKSLVELKHLEVIKCKIMEEIISTEDQSNGENIDIIFSKLESLSLAYLPKLTRFCPESCTDISPVNELDTEVGASIFDHPPTSSKNPDVRTCLFDARVKLPSLKRLDLCKLGKLKTLWNNKLGDQDSFHKLREVDVRDCDSLMNMFVPSMMSRLNALDTLVIRGCRSLKVVFEEGESDVADTSSSSPQEYCQNLGSINICDCESLRKMFPASVARGLQKLHTLTVGNCYKVEEIISGEQGLETEPPQFVFPKVARIDFYNMPELGRFYPGMHVSNWPLLKDLSVLNCGKEETIKVLAAELAEKHEQPQPGQIEQSLFLIQKDSFPKLEELNMNFTEIWYGPSSPALVFSTLKSISFYHRSPFSKQATIDFLHKLPRLAELHVINNDSMDTLFVTQEMNGGEEIHPVGTLSSVKTLVINHMDKLLKLGNGNSETAGPVFPNLDTLYVFFCKKLKSLESSAVSFRYLTSLNVSFCGGLEYLTSYDVAKSLMQLTKLEVTDCLVLREIVRASNEDAHDTSEIAFSRLQVLKLQRLPRLQEFCSGNCIVKLPSSRVLDVSDCPIALKISSQGVMFKQEKIKKKKKKQGKQPSRRPGVIQDSPEKPSSSKSSKASKNTKAVDAKGNHENRKKGWAD